MSASPRRCPTARSCGGCEWLDVPYKEQLRRKRRSVEDEFFDMLQSDGGILNEIVGMAEPSEYRAKMATPFAPGRDGKGIQFGFYAQGTHRIVPCDNCLVEYPVGRKVISAVARAATWIGIPAYDEDESAGVLRHAVVRAGYATSDVLLTVVTNGDRLPKREKFVREILRHAPEVTSIVQNINERRTNAILGRESHVLYGPGVMHDRLLGCTFEIGPTSFYQTNPQQTELLYRAAIDAAQLMPEQRVLDAYCGTGTIGICAASKARGVEVVGVDQVADGIDCARRNAEANGLVDRCSFVHADATAYMRDVTKSGAKGFDVVIMDPPRAGSTPEFLDGLADMGTERISYVSCNHHTQARDIAHLRTRGYRLEELTPVDMFPHTKHVETVALLSRAR